MPKAFFTQSVCILLSRPTTLDEIEPLLRDFVILRRDEGAERPEMSGPSLVIAFRPEVNGYASVDLQSGRWPDHMGDPEGEPMLFGAWSMGHYGPFAFPGNLERAAQQAYAFPPHAPGLSK